MATRKKKRDSNGGMNEKDRMSKGTINRNARKQFEQLEKEERERRQRPRPRRR